MSNKSDTNHKLLGAHVHLAAQRQCRKRLHGVWTTCTTVEKADAGTLGRCLGSLEFLCMRRHLFHTYFDVSGKGLLFVSRALLWTWHGCSFSVKCGNTRKSTHPSLWHTCLVLHPSTRLRYSLFINMFYRNLRQISLPLVVVVVVCQMGLLESSSLWCEFQ